MVPSQLPNDGADRNVLFGILAVNLSFITRDQLMAAMTAWVLDKDRSLGDVLLEQQALTPERHALLAALVVEHLKQHGNDPHLSLEAVSSVASVKKELEQLADPALTTTLEHVARSDTTRRKDDTSFTVGTPTAGQRFRILRPHAKGGLGQVFVAEDQELHREVALKEIQDKHAHDQESRSRFLVEAEITGALEHPGIVPVYGLGQYADGRPYYAMRFIRGDSLKEVIEAFHKADVAGRDPGERSLELRKMLGRFIDVCEAIQYAHDRGVLHRDLKPGNIMLGKYGETLVVDWGLAKALDHLEQPSAEPLVKPMSASGNSETLPGAAVGTPQYMSPEQAMGRLDLISPASDVYSLGATLYCVLTGKASVEDSKAERPGKGDILKLLGKVGKGEFPRPRDVKPTIDRPLEAICLKAMALRPEDRYHTPRDLASDLEHWLADEPVSAWPEPWHVKARRWIGQHRTLVTGTAAALVVGAVSLLISTVLLASANEVIRDRNDKLSDANRKIEAESQEKEKQRQIAVAAHKKAEERLDQSVETLKLFAIDTRTYCEDAMVPGESKAKLFDVLLGQLESLAAGDQDQEFNEDKVRARIFLYETVALTQIELGRIKMAEPSLTKALNLTDAWLAAKPGDPGALGRRAAVLHLFGVVNSRRLNLAAALKYLNDGLAIRQKLLGNEKVERFTPGKTRTDLADSLDELGRWDEALKLRLEVLAVVEKRIADGQSKPDDAFAPLDSLNWTYQKAAAKTNDDAKRKFYLDQANASSALLLKLRPTARVAMERWAKNLEVYGATELRQRESALQAKDEARAKVHLSEAEKQFAGRADIARRLAISPELLAHRRQFAVAVYDQARLERTLGREQQAARLFEQSLGLYDELLRDYGSGKFSDLATSRLRALAQLGRHAEAAAEADRIGVKLADKYTTFGLARTYALCSRAVEAAAPAALTAADKALQASYRDKALRCLDDAIKSGFDDWAALRSELDLDAVRDEPRFRQTLEKIRE